MSDEALNAHIEIEMTWDKWKDLLEYIAKLESTNAELLEALEHAHMEIADNSEEKCECAAGLQCNQCYLREVIRKAKEKRR